jgi:antitoxin ParD1/3/4
MLVRPEVPVTDISLDPRDEKFLQDQVASGRYRDEAEVVREGLRLLEERDRKIAQLRKEIQDAIEQGGDHTADDIRADLAAMIAAEEEGR